VFAQLRHRERRAGRTGSLFFWRDRAREVDFAVEIAGDLELYEAKWTELPTPGDAVNVRYVRDLLGSKVKRGGVVCRTRNEYPLPHDLRALPVSALA
jgi:hypothetical protein